MKDDFKEIAFDPTDFKPLLIMKGTGAPKVECAISIKDSTCILYLPLEMCKKNGIGNKASLLQHKSNKRLLELRSEKEKDKIAYRTLMVSGKRVTGYFTVDLTNDFLPGRYELEAIERPEGLFFFILVDSRVDIKKISNQKKEVVSHASTTSDVDSVAQD